ncbi:MAG: manganese-binding transcriptional regulator MntR [Phycisphaerales bacterium]|nr:manganese-binding transcriptional regulator MntR [Phycisphaerales bacterium]
MHNDQPSDLGASERFVSTRRAHRDETAEDYTEAIDQLITQHGCARVGELAELMGVSHVTVTRIIARLQREGLVETERRKPITLTQSGQLVARASRMRHEVVLGFLLAAGVPIEQARIDAEGIEHHVSQETLEALRTLTAKLGNSVQ